MKYIVSSRHMCRFWGPGCTMSPKCSIKVASRVQIVWGEWLGGLILDNGFQMCCGGCLSMRISRTALWSVLIIPNIGHMLQPIEGIIRTELAPALTRRPPPNDHEFHSTTQPRLLIWSCCCQLMANAEIHKQKRQQWTLATTSKFYPTLYKRSRYLAEVKGVSSWLTSLPIGFSLQGGLALSLQYDWQPTCTYQTVSVTPNSPLKMLYHASSSAYTATFFLFLFLFCFFWPA